ncbi:MAG: helix-turn-helix domain-containing protein [Candidatus Hodarchaeales archaeon]|jgi:F0F1-type ATP synthase membrane subunit b/b'
MEKFPLNLTEDEKKAYEMLLAFGQLSVGELSQYGGVEYEQTENIFKSLSEKGYASQVSAFRNKVIPKFPFLETHQHFQELSDKIHQVDYQSKKFYDERKSDLEKFKSDKNSEIKESVQQRVDEFSKHSEDLKQKIDATISEFDLELATIEESYISDANSKTDSIIESEKNKITLKKDNFDTRINSSQTRVLDTLNNHKSTLNTISDEFTTNTSNFSTEYLNEVKNKLKTLLDNIRGDLSKFESDFDNNGKEWTKSSLDTQMEAYNTLGTALDEIYGNNQTSLANQETAINELVLDSESTEVSEEAVDEVVSYINTLLNYFSNLKSDLTQKMNESLEKYNMDKNQAGSDVESYKNESLLTITGIKDNYGSNLAKNTSDVEEQINSTINSNQNATPNLTDQLINDFNSLEEIRKETLTQIRIDMETQQEQALTAQKTSLATLESNILGPFNTELLAMKNGKKKFFTDITKTTDDHHKNLEARMTNLSEGLKTKFDKFTEKTQTVSSDGNVKANQELEKYIKDQQKIVSNEFKDIRKPLTNQQSSTEKQITDIQSKLTSEFEFLDQTVTTHYNNSKNALELIKKSIISDLSADITKLVDSTSNEAEKTSKTDLINKVKDSVSKRLQEAEKTIQKSSDELDSKLSEPFKKHLIDLSDRKEKLSVFLNESSTAHFASLNTNVDDLDKQIEIKLDNLTQKLSKSVESAFSKLKGDYKKFVKEQYKLTDDQIKEEKTLLKDYKKEAIKQIKEINKIFSPELKRLENGVKSFSQESLNLITSLDTIIITGIPDELKNNITRTTEELVQNSEKAKTSVQSHLDSWLNSLKVMNDRLHEINQVNKTQHENEIKNIENDMISVLNKISDKVHTFNGHIHFTASEHTQAGHDNYQSLLKDSLSTIQSSLIQIVQEQQKMNSTLKTQKEESFVNQNLQIQDRYTKISDNLNTFVTNFKETSQNRVNEKENETNDFHQEATTKILDETSKIKENYKSEVTQTIEQHDKDYREHHSDLTNSSHEFLQIIENDAVSFAQDVKDDSIERTKSNISLLKEKTNYVRTVHDQFASSVGNAVSTSNQLRDGLIGTVNEHYDKLTTGNEGFSKELLTTITSGLDILRPKITIMEDFERIIKEYQYPTVTSLPVIGRGAALHTLDFYLSDFKAHVTMLVPNPREIPLDAILATNRPKRVTVASMLDLDNPQDKEMVKKLTEKDNVTVRILDPAQYRGTTASEHPNYLSADRDAEEIFFGAYDLENKAEFAGMVSQNQSIIEWAGKVLLSDFLTRAKKIDRI